MCESSSSTPKPTNRFSLQQQQQQQQRLLPENITTTATQLSQIMTATTTTTTRLRVGKQHLSSFHNYYNANASNSKSNSNSNSDASSWPSQQLPQQQPAQHFAYHYHPLSLVDRVADVEQERVLMMENNNYEKVTGDDDTWNYVLLIVLYTLQGIPMGLSASIPFLIQQKIKHLLAHHHSNSPLVVAATTATENFAVAAATTTTTATTITAVAQALSYRANAMFALCAWPFSLKLLWAPIVDACFVKRWGRRKSWLVPVQMLAGVLMVLGSPFVERQLGLQHNPNPATTAAAAAVDTVFSMFQIQGVTWFFLVLYFLMATQDIAVDGWALTLLSPHNRGRGPVCNSIGHSVGYFLSFVGFLALNDAEIAEKWLRPLLKLPSPSQSQPMQGLVSLGTFLRTMGYVMLITTAAVAIFKKEVEQDISNNDINSDNCRSSSNNKSRQIEEHHHHHRHDDATSVELDASVIGLRETYRRLWAVCRLPAVRWLFVILLSYRLPTSLSDNVKLLKAVEFGLSPSTTALLSPAIILPIGILVPIVATRIWHGQPLRQFMTAYRFRVTLVPLLEGVMLWMLRKQQQEQSLRSGGGSLSGRVVMPMILVIVSTAAQAIVQSAQFNAQMTFFAQRVDPTMGGSYMTLLNTAANLGGTWPSSVILWILSRLSSSSSSSSTTTSSPPVSSSSKSSTVTPMLRKDPYFALQAVLSVLGLVWIVIMEKRVQSLAQLPEHAWRISSSTTTTTTSTTIPTRTTTTINPTRTATVAIRRTTPFTKTMTMTTTTPTTFTPGIPKELQWILSSYPDNASPTPRLLLSNHTHTHAHTHTHTHPHPCHHHHHQEEREMEKETGVTPILIDDSFSYNCDHVHSY